MAFVGLSLWTKTAPYTTSVTHLHVPQYRSRRSYATRAILLACVEPSTASSTLQQTTFRSEYTGRIPEWLLSRLDSLSLHEPTPIQQRSLRVSLGSQPEQLGADVVLHAETGSGKTLAYLLPVLSALEPSRNSVQAVVLVPTPELCAQVVAVARRLAAASPVDIPVFALQEGAHRRRQAQQLRAAAPRLVIASVRAVKALADARRLRLDLVRILVVDEFDAILADAAAVADLHAVLSVHVRDSQRQTILASATVPQHNHFIRTCVSRRWTRAPLIHVALQERRVPELLSHFYALCVRGRKLPALRALLDAQLRATSLRCIVFIGKARDAFQIASALEISLEQPVVAADEHLPDGARREALARFRDDARVLVATDLAARGLDVPDIAVVFQLDLPADADNYLHRAGRSARAGLPGRSVLLVEQGERFVLERLANALDVEFGRIRKSAD